MKTLLRFLFFYIQNTSDRHPKNILRFFDPSGSTPDMSINIKIPSGVRLLFHPFGKLVEPSRLLLVKLMLKLMVNC